MCTQKKNSLYIVIDYFIYLFI